MNNINIFESSSTFETASGGGTLAYPNTSLITETNSLYMQMSKPISIVSFCLLEWYDNACFTYFKFEDGMTWEQYFNSDYSKNLEGNVSFEGTCAEVYYDYNDMLTYCTPSITYTLDADNNVVLEVETLADNWTPGGGCKGAMQTTHTITTQMKLTDKIPNSDLGQFQALGSDNWSFYENG